MIAPQTYSSYPTFGASATKCQPVQVKYETGYIPGDVLPAEHLNWFLAGATSNITLASAGIVNLQQEMQTILCCAGQAPSSCLTCVDQVYNAMMYQINASAAQRAPTAHASSATTYGVGTADCYGHLKISDTYTEVLSACSGVAASQKALACVYATAGGKAGVGNTAGCPIGTASAGAATTAARSDHVHPLTGLATIGFINGNNYSGLGAAGNYVNYIRTPQDGLLPYCEDAVNGKGYIGTPGWPFYEMNAKRFRGNLSGSASHVNRYAYNGAPYTFSFALFDDATTVENTPLYVLGTGSLTYNTANGNLVNNGLYSVTNANWSVHSCIGHLNDNYLHIYTDAPFGIAMNNSLLITQGNVTAACFIGVATDAINATNATNVAGEKHGQVGLVCWSRSENTHIWTVTANSLDTIECDIFKALLCASNGDYRNITGNLNKIASIFGSFTVSRCTADCFFEADYMCITNDNIYIMNCDRNLTEQKWNLNTQDPRPFTIGGAFFNFY